MVGKVFKEKDLAIVRRHCQRARARCEREFSLLDKRQFVASLWRGSGETPSGLFTSTKSETALASRGGGIDEIVTSMHLDIRRREMGGIVYVIVTLGTVRILLGEQEKLGFDLAGCFYA